MRKLTFEGFLKQYVAELSGIQTVSVHKLADCMTENPRLKEPLFLYVLTFDKVDPNIYLIIAVLPNENVKSSMRTAAPGFFALYSCSLSVSYRTERVPSDS